MTDEEKTAEVELPITILAKAQVGAYNYGGNEVVAFAAAVYNTDSEQMGHILILIAPEDAGPLGRQLVSTASPLKPLQKKESK